MKARSVPIPLAIPALLVLLAVPPGSLASPGSDCERLVAAFDNAAAADCFARELEARPADFGLRCELIRALIDAGEDAGGDAAEAWYHRAEGAAAALAAEHPDSAAGHYYLAVARGRIAQFLGGKDKVRLAGQVRESVDRALELDPGHAEALLTRGIYFYELATLNSALRFFAGVLYGGLPEGSLEDARRDLEASLRLDPGNTNTLYHLALLAWEREDWDGCLELCRRVAARPVTDHLDPRNKERAAELAARADRRRGRERERR